MSAPIYDFECETIEGKPVTLKEYKGKVMLIVNTASKCGLTPQYKGLQSLYDKYKEQGFTVLGFPCNQFLSQEPGTESEIVEFCETNYGVTFPMFKKIEVNGDNTHPLFKYLKEQAPGLMGSKNLKWNFTKFLINRDGEVIKRFSPKTEPETFEKEIKDLL
jgi:glutathione peroxidase